MVKGLTAQELRAQAERVISQRPKSEGEEGAQRIRELTKQLADDTIATLEDAAFRAAENGEMSITRSLPTSVYDEKTQERFIVHIDLSVAKYFEDKGFKVAFKTSHERLDDGIGWTSVPVETLTLSWAS